MIKIMVTRNPTRLLKISLKGLLYGTGKVYEKLKIAKAAERR